MGLEPTWGWESQISSGFVDWHKLWVVRASSSACIPSGTWVSPVFGGAVGDWDNARSSRSLRD